MLNRIQHLATVNGIRDYINETLCEQCELENGAFPMTERILVRRDKPCGIIFCIHGPRATRFSAIWETDRNQILFYGSDGERFLTTKVVEGPQMALNAC
jgi:hypothetical protein